MKRFGIDVSTHNGNIDWGSVKGHVDFAIIRAGYGNALAYPNQVDNTFERNYNGCKANGIPCGVYWYSYADSVEDVIREAKSCIAQIKGKKFEYPIFFDLEESAQFARGTAFCDSLVKAFCGELEKTGYWAGLYISRSPLQNYISAAVASRYALWVAEYNDKCYYDGDYGMWQYSSTGGVSGVGGNVDCNYCYVDYPAKIKAKGLNGYPKPVKPKPVMDKSGYKLKDSTIGCLAFKELLLIAYKLKLTKHKVAKDNGFGKGTQNAVNELLGKWGYQPNGIAGANFIKRLHTEIDKKIK